jgi:hypothetical protein
MKRTALVGHFISWARAGSDASAPSALNLPMNLRRPEGWSMFASFKEQ